MQYIAISNHRDLVGILTIADHGVGNEGSRHPMHDDVGWPDCSDVDTGFMIIRVAPAYLSHQSAPSKCAVGVRGRSAVAKSA